MEKAKKLVKSNQKIKGEHQILQIKDIVKSEDITFKAYLQLITMTQDFGKPLSPDYVQNQLDTPGKNVVVYRTNNKIVGDNRDEPSGFAIYQLKQEDDTIICEVLALVSAHNKKKIHNMLVTSEAVINADKENQRSCGDAILEDIQEWLLDLMKLLPTITRAKITLEALNIEYVVCFYAKHGFVPDQKTPSEDSLIPMKLDVKEKCECVEKLHAKRTLVYKGTNNEGNKFYTFSDGSYSYVNLDRRTRGLVSIYHSATCSHEAEIDSVPIKRRRMFDETETNI